MTQWIDETVPVDPPPGVESVPAAESNAARFTEAGRVGVVLRFGFFYGPGSEHSEEFLRAARHRVGMAAGSPKAYQSSIHLADAASAVVAALGAPAGIYNVVDDEPLTKKAYVRAVGAAVGKRPWLLLPGRLTSIGGKRSEVLTRSQRVRNTKFKEATGWSPSYPSAREGLAGAGAAPCVTRPYTTVLLALMVVQSGFVGLWAALAPRSFYDDFPGGGHHWISAAGPFNEHLIRDVGTLNLALAAIAVAALVRPDRYLVQVVAGATLVSSAPHFLYHLFHLDVFDTTDKVLQTTSLALTVLVPRRAARPRPANGRCPPGPGRASRPQAAGREWR